MLSQKRTPTHKQTPQLAEQVKNHFQGLLFERNGNENQKQAPATSDVWFGNGSRATANEGECLHHYVTLSPAYFTSQHYLSLLIILSYLSLSIVHSSPPRQTSSSMQTYFRSLNVLYNLRIIGKSESDDKKFKDKEMNSLPSLCL